MSTVVDAEAGPAAADRCASDWVTEVNDMDIDDRLRDWGARARAATVDPPGVPVDRLRRRRSRAAIVAPVAVVLAVVGAILGSQLFGGSDDPPPTPAYKPYTFDGLTVSVPSSWAFNRAECSTPTRDTVLIPSIRPACLGPPGEHVGIAAFNANSRITRPTRSTLTIDGHRVEKVTGISAGAEGYRLASGDPIVRLTVPDWQVSVTIQAPDQQIVDRIAGSARLLDTDANGCLSHRLDLVTLPTARAPAREGADTALIPGEPTHIAVCRYEDGGVVQSSSIPEEDSNEFTERINGLPPGLSEESPVSHVESVCGDERNDPHGYTIVATYAEGPPVTVWARLGTCDLLGATNGTRTGQRTQTLVDLVLEHAGGTYWPMHVAPVK